MKILSCYVLGFSLTTCSVCFAQIDIFQSDAYSVEEMCAREAQQSTSMDYTEAYESCIRRNGDKPMYRNGHNTTDSQNSDGSNPGDEAGVDGQYQDDPGVSQEQPTF